MLFEWNGESNRIEQIFSNILLAKWNFFDHPPIRNLLRQLQIITNRVPLSNALSLSLSLQTTSHQQTFQVVSDSISIVPSALPAMSYPFTHLLTAPAKCPGIYCGRMPNENASGWSDCGACPAGFRVANAAASGATATVAVNSACLPCLDDSSAYDWMYLGFMAIVPLCLHWFSIDVAARRAAASSAVMLARHQLARMQLALHGSALLEIGGAALLTLLAFEPYGRLHFHTCSVRRLSDWYTLIYNPTPDYANKLFCTQEAVYPL